MEKILFILWTNAFFFGTINKMKNKITKDLEIFYDKSSYF